MERAIIITITLFTMILFTNQVTAQDHQHHEKHEQMMHGNDMDDGDTESDDHEQ